MYEAVLNHIHRDIELTREEENYFTSLLQHRKYRKGQFILREGEICKFDTYVIKGVLRLYYTDDSGKEHIVLFGREDKWISDFESYMNQVPARLNIESLENCEVFQFYRKDLDELFRKIPKYESFLRKKLQGCFTLFQGRLVDSLCMNSKERYLKFLEQYRDIEQRIPQHYIASFLGITPQFLSQVRAELRTSSKTTSEEKRK
jgi:CRP-like cAMP-binding protein